MPCPALLLTFDALHEAAVLFDSEGNVLHGNLAAEQLFGWNVKGSGGPDHGVSSMLAFPRQPSSSSAAQHAQSQTPERGTSDSSVQNGVPSSSGSIVGNAVTTGGTPAAGQQPLLTFNPADASQHESWVSVVSSLNEKKICQRDGVGFRLEGSPSEAVSFPVSVNLLKMRDGDFAPSSSPSSPSPQDTDETYVCAFVNELAHAADQWSRQHRAMSMTRNSEEHYNDSSGSVSLDGIDGQASGAGGTGSGASGDRGRRRLPALDEIQLEQKQMLTAAGIIEASIDPMFSINEKGVIMMVNEAATRDFGWTRREFIGSNISMIVGGGHSKNHDQYIRRYLKTGEKRVMGKKRELVARDRAGKEFPIELGLTEIVHKGGKVTFTGVVRDLSDQKHDKVELRLKHSLTLSIIEASFDAMFYMNERGIIQMVNEAAVEQFGWTREEFLGSNISMICGGGRAPNHDNYIKRYLRTGEKRVMGKKRELRARRRDGSEFPIELGLTEVKVRKGEERSFCGFIRDLTREKEQQMEVKRKQRLTVGIIDAAFDPMFAINERGIIQMVNEAATKQLGWEREELIGSNISMIVGGGHAERHDQYIEQYLQTGEKRVMGLRRELPARRKDGTEFTIELGLTEVKTEDGEERLFTGFLRDVTNIKRKQRLTAGIIDASFDPMFAINEKGIINMVNEAAIKEFGWTRDDFIGSNIRMIVGGGHAENHDQYIKRYLKTGEKRVMGVRRELAARRADGTEFPIELGLTEVKVEEGEERLFTGFVRSLADIKRKQRLTAGIIDASFDPVFAINEKGIINMVNKAAVKQFGWTQEDFIGSNISMIVGGGHAKNHDEYIKRYLKTGEKRVMGVRRELAARRADGSEFPIELGLAEIKVCDGEEREFVGFVRDITLQKKQEAQLIEKQTLTEGLIEASLDAMFAIDEQGRIQIVNSAAIKQFGWSRTELLGQNIRMIVGPEHSGKHDMYIKRYLRTGEAKILGTQRELEAKRRNGSLFPISLGVSEVSHSGEKRMFAAYIHDLSERHRIIEMEKAELLLLNMLPEDIALRLKAEEGHIADHFPSVAILFADIVGFTKMSSKMKPTELVGMLNEVFSIFDALVDKYDLNKVKTIGDCYMVTSHPDEDTEVEEITHVCHFALDMIDAIISYNIDHPGKNLNLRIGINVGPVVAGVVGKKRFLYDIWGDAVNLASRMESTGVPGKIHCTKAIVDLVGTDFEFESRGETDVKSVGKIETYFLTQRKRLLPARPARARRPQRRRSSLLVESLNTLKSSRQLLEEKIEDIQTRLDDKESSNNS